MSQIFDAIKDADCKLLVKDSPVLEGLMGEAVVLLSAFAKALQVERADNGAKDGLHKRVELRRLPATCQNPYGYRWDEGHTRLLSTPDWENRSLIVHLYLNGATIHGIRGELHRQGILSPKGREWWPDPTIWGILNDSVNCAEYRALRRENVEPKVRRGKADGSATYGKTSSRKLEGVLLPNIMVEKPTITRAQQEWIWKRLEQNKLNAKRNGKRDYLLRGLITYEGDNIRYHGTGIRGNSWAYVHSRNGKSVDNPIPYINGPKLEAKVEAMARHILTSGEVLERELGCRQDVIQETITRLEAELRRLARQENSNRNAESELIGLRARYKDRVSDEAFERQLALIEAQRKWIAEQRERVSSELEQLKAKSISLVGLEQLRDRVEKRLTSKEFADRRFVIEALGTRVVVTEEGNIEVEFSIPNGAPREVNGAIALSVPQSVCPRYSVVPTTLPFWALR
jgi:uncharacterized protein YecT (DUF1311 family)